MTNAERDAVAVPEEGTPDVWEPGGLARLVFDVAGVATGLVFAGLSLELGLEKGERVGPGFFPLIASLLLAGCLGADALRELVRWRRSGREAGTGRVPLSLVFILLSLGFYAVSVEFLGHMIACAILVAVLVLIVGKRPWWQIALFAVLTAVITDLVFSALLGLRLPTGILEVGWREWI